MLCSNICEEKEDHNELQLWSKGFPKGLRVLILYDDVHFATQTKNKLQHIDYVVSLYSNNDEALDVISKNVESFHVAILEVTSDNCLASFKFLEAVRDLPIIVASSDSSLSTMMKCISLGAAEFLQKPLSEEKLKNIWQHVVHKAFNSGRDECSSITKSLKPIKEMVVSMLHLKHDENMENANYEIHEKLTTPCTPKLENKKSSFGNKEDSEERTNLRSAEKTCNDSTTTPSRNNKTEEEKKMQTCEEEVNSDEIAKPDECSTAKERNNAKSSMMVLKKKKYGSLLHGSKGNKKKSKVDWTPSLHKKFVKAVEQLGIDQAIPSKILDLMKVEGLTRHNVASHLQKYRMHRRHILPKDEEKRWPNPQGVFNVRSYMQRPILTPYPPIMHQYYNYSNIKVPSQPYLNNYQYHHYPPFQPWHVPVPRQDNWQPVQGVQADTWGCPVFPPPNYGHYYAPLPPRSASMCNGYGTEHLNTSNSLCLEEVDEEMIEKVVKEAMAEPWGPLPIGLKSPSTDSVLSELHRLGIRAIPAATKLGFQFKGNSNSNSKTCLSRGE